MVKFDSLVTVAVQMDRCGIPALVEADSVGTVPSRYSSRISLILHNQGRQVGEFHEVMAWYLFPEETEVHPKFPTGFKGA